MEKFLKLIPVIPEEQKYWFIQTRGLKKGDLTIEKNYIGIRLPVLLNTGQMAAGMADSQGVSERISGEREEYRQLLKIFCCEINQGDLIIVPADEWTKVHFGIVRDGKEEAFPTDKGGWKTGENPGPQWPVMKKREVQWVKSVGMEELDPHLFRLFYTKFPISDAGQYADFIDKSLHDFYIKGGRCHFILHVQRREPIKARHFIPFMNDLLSIADAVADGDDADLDMKVSVQSFGTIELIGQIPNIIITSLVVVALIGGKTKVFGFELDTPGIVGRILEWLNVRKGEKEKEAEQPDLIEKQAERLKTNAENLEIKIPDELQKALQTYLAESGEEKSEKQKVRETE